ncbi:MAG: sterol desaturase family protein [Actinobacteria bacterium]|nr:sterol desaturase family protein [Actinomycetota bacterium]
MFLLMINPESNLESIAEILENLLFPILVIELVWLWRRGRLDRNRVKEMFANASSLLIVIPAGVLGFVLWLQLFEAIHGWLGYSIRTTWASAIVCVILADLIYYLEHRFEHEHRLPWDLYHSVHHSSESYDQTTGLRLSGFDALLTLGFLLPLVFLGFSPTLILVAAAVVIGYQTWIHTEVVKRTPRWFEAVFNTPSHHRAHHGADDIYLDKNYGGILIIWDRLFGTFQSEVRTPNYGLTTQIESSNPVDIQFSEIRKLVADLRTDTSWRTRLRRLWNRPGWQPDSVVV